VNCSNVSACSNHAKSHCDPNSDIDPDYHLESFGVTGVTYWGPVGAVTLNSNDEFAFHFTCTEPKCMSTQHPANVCNIIFHAYSNSSSSSDTDVHLTTQLNRGEPGSTPGDVYLSKIQNHGIWYVTDMAPTGGLLHEPGQNTFIIKNISANTPVIIDGFQIQ
jgi:hypothetical protein